MQKDWVRKIRDACKKQNVAFFFKQWGGHHSKEKGREFEDEYWDEMPWNLIPEETMAAA